MTGASPPLWLVWNPIGDQPRHRHPDQESASREARRLASAHPGHEFYVLCPLSRFQKQDVQVDNYSLDLGDMVPF